MRNLLFPSLTCCELQHYLNSLDFLEDALQSYPKATFYNFV